MKTKQQLKEKCKELGIEYQDVLSKDPSSTKKYTKWIITQLASGCVLADIIPTIQYFHENPFKFDKRDIYQYKTFKELEDIVKDIEFKKSNRKQQKELKEDVPRVFENEDYTLLRIMDNKEAAVYYGKNTRWCITMEEASHFEQYMAENTIFYFLMKRRPIGDNHPFDKVCLSVTRDYDNKPKEFTWFNAQDQVVSEEEVLKNFPGFKEVSDKYVEEQEAKKKESKDTN